MWQKLNSSLEASFCEWLSTLNTVLSPSIELIAVFVEITATGFGCEGNILCSVGNISRMHHSGNEVLSSTSTARFSTITNQTLTRRQPMQMNNCTMPSTFLASPLLVSGCDDLITLIESFQAGGRKPLSIKSGPRPVPGARVRIQ